MTNNRSVVAMMAGVPAFLFVSLGAHAAHADTNRTCGYVGLRPLPRYEADLKSNHGGPWTGMPTFDAQKGNYPFVEEHLDVVKDWLDGDFKTKRVFFEYYWGLSEARDDLDPQKNLLVKTIRGWEEQGGVVEHILICREYDLAIQRGHKDAQPGPFTEDTRILSEKDVDDIRALFKVAHKKGILKHDHYKLIQMVQEPSFFADDKRVLPIIKKTDGIAYECHQFNRHWPLETGWSQPEKVVRGAQWTLAQGKEYVFYYGPIIWKCDRYYPFIERDWLEKYWKAGLPKHHPNMHYYLNTFPHETGRGRPVGPETDPHSILGFTKWLIQEIKMPTTGAVALVTAATSAPVRVLVTYGGHGFQEPEFFALLDSLPGIKYDKAVMPAAANMLKPGLEQQYDVILRYDMQQVFTPTQQQAFIALLHQGIGLVALHHNFGAHDTWEEYQRIIGGRYVHGAPRMIDGVLCSASKFADDQDMLIAVADKTHPVTAGITDFTIHDEAYRNYHTATNVHLLLTTNHEKSDREIAWCTTYGTSRVLTFLLGHDNKAWAHPAFPQILAQGIHWSTGTRSNTQHSAVSVR